MVKALCCHTFARQNLFSPVTRPTAITSSSNWAVVASDDEWVRIYDLLGEPGTVSYLFPSLGKVKSIAFCHKDNWIATLEAGPRPDQQSTQRITRCIRVYRNFQSNDIPEVLPHPRAANQPPKSADVDSRFDFLQFSSLLSPTALSLASDKDATRLLVGMETNVWVAHFDPQLKHFVVQFTVKFDVYVQRVSMLGQCLAAASMHEVHVIRIRDTPPASRFDDEVVLYTLSKERRDLKKSVKHLEVLGPTIDFDSTSAQFNNFAAPKSRSYIETLLYRRFPPTSNIRIHTVQVFMNKEAFVFIATTFEGFLYHIGDSVVRNAEYAFSERTLQARIGSDLLLHVITVCGLNTYTTRLGCPGKCYPVPEQFPICMIGSLVWREINMRSLQAWESGLLLYTERDDLYTLYSLQFQPTDHLFSDMLLTARHYIADCMITSCHLMSEAFHLHSLRETDIDTDKVMVLVEFHMNGLGNIHVNHLQQLFVMKKFELEDIIYICCKLEDNNVDYKPFLHLYIENEKDFVDIVREASIDVMHQFYKILQETDANECVRCILHRNDRNYFSSQENLIVECAWENPEFLLLTCLYLFETSRVDEIDAFIDKGNEDDMMRVLEKFHHILIEEESGQLTDFALFLCLLSPEMICSVLDNVLGERKLPDNLPHCCRIIIIETEFSKDRNSQRLTEVVDSLVTLLVAKQTSSALCPHKNLRCRKVSNWIISQRFEVLNSLSPFQGVDPNMFGAHCSTSCRCTLCHSVIIRLQGYLCFALSLPSCEAIFGSIRDRMEDFPALVRTSLRFLVAHHESIEAGFKVLVESMPIPVIVSYIQYFAKHIESAAVWVRLLRACNLMSEMKWAVLRTAISYCELEEAEKIVVEIEKSEKMEDVRELICERYWSTMREQMFQTAIDQLAT